MAWADALSDAPERERQPIGIVTSTRRGCGRNE